MKVARIATIPFAIVTQLKSQLLYLVDSGVHVHIITSDGCELDRLEWGENLVLHKLHIARKPSLMADFVSLFRLFILFRRFRFQIVHSTTPKAGLLTSIAGLFSGVPIRLHTFTGQPWVEMSGVMRLISRSSDKLIGYLNTRCYADSFTQAKFLVDEGIIKHHKIDVIGSGSLAGVDTNRFSIDRFTNDEKDNFRKQLGINSCSFVILFIGRITKDKGIYELLSAFQKLSNSSVDADLILVGPFDQERGGVGSISINDISKYNKVHCVGYSEEPEKYLSISDVLCLPSYREGFGTVVLEAGSMGVPTIGSDIYGLRDAVVDGTTGILVPVRDAHRLFEALSLVAKNVDLRVDMGEAARQRCINKFDSTKVSQCLLDEYNKLLNSL
ncbi:MAG: glycosyltransferase family 4 protein [Gammaproteobacteria bacterium]|nr:glycosyltransferase family 4 protein [Gammaproteobacteria bacterium]